MYVQAGGNAASSEAGETSRADKKALSSHCELDFADIPADRWARMPFSDLEIEIINQGTNDCDSADWRNIRL